MNRTDTSLIMWMGDTIKGWRMQGEEEMNERLQEGIVVRNK